MTTSKPSLLTNHLHGKKINPKPTSHTHPNPPPPPPTTKRILTLLYMPSTSLLPPVQHGKRHRAGLAWREAKQKGANTWQHQTKDLIKPAGACIDSPFSTPSLSPLSPSWLAWKCACVTWSLCHAVFPLGDLASREVEQADRRRRNGELPSPL